MGLNHNKELEGDDYLAEEEYEDEDVARYNYKDDNEVDINLHCRPPRNFHNTSTGYVPNLSNQQRCNVAFADVSPISTNTNDCVINQDLPNDTTRCQNLLSHNDGLLNDVLDQNELL